jgi:hypothetical protein
MIHHRPSKKQLRHTKNLHFVPNRVTSFFEQKLNVFFHPSRLCFLHFFNDATKICELRASILFGLPVFAGFEILHFQHAKCAGKCFARMPQQQVNNMLAMCMHFISLKNI